MSWLRREDLEAREREILAPCATFSDTHGGRLLPENEDPMRTAFQRDRDRVIHSAAFRRLQHKTQVFAADEGDHYRSRMTHSLEVSQMARSTALALRLNPDLTEAIALAHDLGHPPFGHVGEDALDTLMREEGGFRHNAQGARIVDVLEERHGQGSGLNLTRATRLSLLKGAIPPGFPLRDDLLLRDAPPIEAVLVDRCDKIAYVCHDLDDAIRAGLVTVAAASRLGLWQLAAERTESQTPSRVFSEMVATQVHDLVDASHEAISDGSMHPAIRHSDDIKVKSQELLAFLREHFYRSDRVLTVMDRGSRKIEACFARYLADPGTLPAKIQKRIDVHGVPRVVCDYVAGMTDRFLMRQ